VSGHINNYNSINLKGEEAATQRPRISSNKKIILRKDRKECRSQ